MRAVVVRPGPAFSVQDVANGWIKGLSANGVQVVDFNFDDRLAFYTAAHMHSTDGCLPASTTPQQAARMAAQGIHDLCYKVWPDLVLIVSGFFIPPETFELLRSRRHKVVLIHTESPYEDDKQIPRAHAADLNVVNDPTNLDRFPAGSFYVPHAYDPEIHYPRNPEPELASDFCFVGTGYPSRVEFLEQVDWTGIDVALGGNWHALDEDSPLRSFVAHPIDHCLDNTDTVRLYTSSRVSANLYRKEASDTADGWAMGPREVELAACGTFFLREPRGEGDELFPMLPTFTGPDEFGELLRWWLAHPELRDKTARAAREAVADRTFERNASRLLARL